MADSNTTTINAAQPTNTTVAASGNTTESSTNLTLAHLNLLSSAVLVAQKRGTYSLEESAALVEPVKLVVELVKKSNEQSQNTNSASPTASNDNNSSNMISSNNDPKLVVE